MNALAQKRLTTFSHTLYDDEDLLNF